MLRTFTGRAIIVAASFKREPKAMTNTITPKHERRRKLNLRISGWALIAGLLTAPAIAMRFTTEVRWTAYDFMLASVVLIGAGGMAEWAVRASSTGAYRLGAGLAVLASVLLLWINGAVGIIGSEDHPANSLYLGVIIAAFIGAVTSRFRARGLAFVMISTAGLQTLIGAVAVLQGWGAGSENWPRPVIVLSVAFSLIWLASAAAFRRAARAGRRAGADETSASLS